ncbi:MAG: hypothetical protein FWD57_07630 [Polyangiaceae bacterium]|nr:hypothetical protein [Polyangiaceae bacterium]
MASDVALLADGSSFGRFGVGCVNCSPAVVRVVDLWFWAATALTVRVRCSYRVLGSRVRRKGDTACWEKTGDW